MCIRDSSTALHLIRRGCDVTIIEKEIDGKPASFGNAAWLSGPSITPVLTPGAIYKIPKMLFSKDGPLGMLGLLFTPTVMLLGQIMLIAPIIAGMTISALNTVSEEIRDTATSLGANRSQVIYTVIKEARYGVITGLLLAFGRAISEVGLAIMVGGNIKNYTRTLTTSMSLETSMGNLDMSMALGIILITVALVVNMVGNILKDR